MEILPVLDLGLKVVNNKVISHFYLKPMSSPYQMLYTSAIPQKTKRDSLLQEGLRRLRNFSTGVPEAIKNDCMSRFMNSLRISGYDQKFRYELLKGIQAREAQIEQEINSGNRVRYRSREQILEQKAKSLGKYPNTWFLRGPIQNTLKVPGAPESRIVNTIREKFGKDRLGTEGGATKFVELGGKLTTSGLSKPVSF